MSKELCPLNPEVYHSGFQKDNKKDGTFRCRPFVNAVRRSGRSSASHYPTHGESIFILSDVLMVFYGLNLCLHIKLYDSVCKTYFRIWFRLQSNRNLCCAPCMGDCVIACHRDVFLDTAFAGGVFTNCSPNILIWGYNAYRIYSKTFDR